MYRTNFPYFDRHPGVTYLDSAATTHKPTAVINAVRSTYEEYAPIHRGLYPSSVELTEKYENVRADVARFLGVVSPHEIVFTKHATEGLNLLAAGLPIAGNWQPGDEVILSAAEHHANLLPWHTAAARHSLTLKFLELDDRGVVDVESLPSLLTERTRVISLTHVSNVIGTITDLPRVRQILSEQGSATIFIADACQSVPHFPVSVPALGVDFLVFSGHKLYAPAGVGVLWGKAPLLASLPPLLTGGDMVVTASRTSSTYQPSPQRFEAGTPNVEAVLGLGAAIGYLKEIGMDQVATHTHGLSAKTREHLQALPGLRIIGDPDPLSGIVSFSLQTIHPHDAAQFLGDRGVCVRAGNQCAGPLHDDLGLIASLRVSIGLYNTEDDLRALIEGIGALYHTFHVY